MSVGVPIGLDNGGDPVEIDPDETVRLPRRHHGIERDLQTAVRSILEADRHGQSTGHFPVGLALGGACPDGCPADEIGKILGSHRVEQFGGAGYTAVIQGHENGAGSLQAFGNVTTPVQMRVIDQSFPPNRRPRFFKVSPHDDQQVVVGVVTDFLECGPVGIGCFGVMNGAWPNDHEEPVLISSIEDVPDGLTRLKDRFFRGRGDRTLFLDLPRGHQFFDFNDVSIIEGFVHKTIFPRNVKGS